MKKPIYATLRDEIADRWAIVLGQMCPFHVAEPVERFVAAVGKLHSKEHKEDADIEAVIRLVAVSG